MANESNLYNKSNVEVKAIDAKNTVRQKAQQVNPNMFDEAVANAENESNQVFKTTEDIIKLKSVSNNIDKDITDYNTGMVNRAREINANRVNPHLFADTKTFTLQDHIKAIRNPDIYSNDNNRATKNFFAFF